ncbi:MFS transporter [Clostridium estertheticum]|uniref:MFS transporter n=1 Tax=Clostridium estertheticum TaxID=238834 RepID=UPI0035C7B47A
MFAKSLGSSGSGIGWITSASTIPGILISYIAGDLADRFGYKKILVGSLLIFASAPFLYLLVKNPMELGRPLKNYMKNRHRIKDGDFFM